MKEILVPKLREICERVGDGLGVEVVDVELLGGGAARLLRVYIDRPDGVTHGDCEAMSQRVGELLDADDVIPDGSYTLEVSSPGVERKLSKVSDFERFTGKKVKISVRQPVEDSRRLEGTIIKYADGNVFLEVVEGRVLEIPFADISKANLKFEW